MTGPGNNLTLAPASYSKAHLDSCADSIDTLFTSVESIITSPRGSGRAP